jgi:hypothetical protein
MLPEFQGGSYDSWGGSGYPNCYALTGTDFENVFYKSNLADGVTIQSNYMGLGGTNWGWLPAPFMYTSYDYGAAIQETGEIGTPSNPNTIPNSKYGENKLLSDFIQATPSLTKSVPVTAQVASVNYANYPTGSSGHTIYMFEQSVPIDSGKTVEAVALPALGDVQGYNPALHIFAIDVGG